MSYSTRGITSPPRLHEHVSCAAPTWRRLLRGLRARGQGVRESGAFLLGTREHDLVEIVDFILYDDLDPHVLDSGIIRFDGRYFGALWERCRDAGLEVVADVHTHPGAAYQSPSDQAHPMIACAGHVALIIPNFAMPPVHIREVGIYRYLGSKKWEALT